MAYIGIAEKVTLTNIEVNQYGGLNLDFHIPAPTQEEGPVADNVLDFMNQEVEMTGKVFDQDNKTSIYALKATKRDGSIIEPKHFQADNTALKEQLNSIVVAYGLPAIAFNPFAGMTMPTTTTDLMKNEVLAQVSMNYFNQFIEVMKKADLTKEFRMKFPRKSQKSNYAGLSNKLLKDFPFIEPMTVPASESKVKFTKYELDNKLHEKQTITPDTNTGGDVASLFGETPTPSNDLDLPFAA